MAKFKLITFIALLGLFLFADFPASADNRLDKREKVKQTYTDQIGVREETGNNDGFMIRQYLASTGLTEGYAWCAAFVHWSLAQAGIRGPAIHPAYSPSWFPGNKIIYHNGTVRLTPLPGDVFGIYFSSKQRIAHVGFIDSWNPDKNFTTTVEGNTNGAGSREGDGVYRKYRNKRQVYQVAVWIQ